MLIAPAVTADVGQQAAGLAAYGRGLLLPGSGGELMDPAAQVVQDARAPLEVVHRADAVRIGVVAGRPVIAGGDGYVVAREDDLSGVAVQEPVGEVAAEGIRPVQAALRPPAGQASACGNAVEHQTAHHTVPGFLGLGDHLAQRGRVLLELVGVGEQVPAGTGSVPQGVSSRVLRARATGRCWCRWG